MDTRQWMRSLLGVPAMALALAAQSATPAPEQEGQLAHRPGEQVSTPEHHSRWDYPKTFTVPEGCQVHFVVKGDTLWDLGARYLGNPFAWPQIWEKNGWIKDAHWIFPGDPLVIPVKAVAVAKAGDTPEGPSAEVEHVRPERGYRNPMAGEFAFSFQDYLQMPYLAPEGWAKHTKALGAMTVLEPQESERYGLGDGEKIYVAGGEDVGAKVGDRKVILKLVRKKLIHPDDRHWSKPLGDVVQQVGVARIQQVQAKGSVAVIERALDAVERGDVLAPYVEPANVPMALRKDVGESITLSEPAIKIVYARDNNGHNGNGAQVVLDKGTKAGLKVGDILIAVREREWSVGAHSKRRAEEKVQMPIGQVMVVRADEHSATGRILRCSFEVGAGTRLVK